MAVKNAAIDWPMGHAAELAVAVGSGITNPNRVDPGVIIATLVLNRKANITGRGLGGRLYTTASKYVKLKLIMESSRYGPYRPSAVETYHYLTYKLHKARTKLTETMSDATDEGR